MKTGGRRDKQGTRVASRASGRGRRHAPVPDAKNAILDAAEQLCGERGIEAVSLRDIAAAAGVHLSALNYYFGTRSSLLVAVLLRRVAELDCERQALLAVAARRDPPDLRELLRAMLLPLTRWRQPRSDRNAAIHFISRALTTSVPELKEHIDRGVLGFRPVIGLLQRALPQLSRAELCWRFHFMMSIEHMNAWDVERLKLLSGGRCNAADVQQSLDRAVDFATAGFLGPVRPS